MKARLRVWDQSRSLGCWPSGVHSPIFWLIKNVIGGREDIKEAVGKTVWSL